MSSRSLIVCYLAAVLVSSSVVTAAPFDVYYRPSDKADWTFYGGRESRVAADAAAADLAKSTGFATKVFAIGEPVGRLAVGPAVNESVTIGSRSYVRRPGLGYTPGRYRHGGDWSTGWGGTGWVGGGWGGGWAGGYGGYSGSSSHRHHSSHHHSYGHHSSSHHLGSHATSHPSRSAAHGFGSRGHVGAAHHAASHHSHSHAHSHSHVNAGQKVQIGELVLFPAVRGAADDVIIAAPGASCRHQMPGTSCRHQIKDGTGRTALHPVEILHAALV